MNKTVRVFVAGSRGLVGSAMIRSLKKNGYFNLITPTHSELDLMDQQAVAGFFKKHQPEYVILAAAKVGGILANNSFPAEFIYNNLSIQNNLIHQSYVQQVTRLLFLGSTCIYPKYCSQPMKEEDLMTGPLEPTNSPYATAKIAGIEMCWSYNRQYGTQFLPVMPTNLYGPNDNFDLQTAHVLPSLIRKFHEAKLNGKEFVNVWGTGSPRREFLHVDDLADACLFILNKEFDDKLFSNRFLYNIGTGKDLSIKELATLIKYITDFKGNIVFDQSKPDGTPLKLSDTSKLVRLGWEPKINLEDGISKVYALYQKLNE